MLKSGTPLLHHRAQRRWIVALVLLLGTALTWVSGTKVREYELAQAEAEVDRQVIAVAEEVNRRLQRYAVAVVAGAGVPDARDTVSTQAWQRFVQSFQLPYWLDGVSALGYAPLQRDTDEQWRAPVQRLEPANTPVRALVNQNLIRDTRMADAVMTAVRANEAILSPRMVLAGGESGVVMLLMPTYKGGQVPIDSEERRRLAVGVVFAVINLDTLFQSMSQWIETKGSFSVIDAPIMEDPEMQLYQSDTVAEGNHAHNVEVSAGGRVWKIQFKELAGHAQVSDRGRSQLTIAVGALATLLLTIAIAYQVALRERTERQLQDSQRSEDTVRALNDELEARVTARTAELSARSNELSLSLEQMQRMQNELVEAEKLASLGALVAGVAHELNTPIGNAVTAASTLHHHMNELKETVAAGNLRRSVLIGFIEQSDQIVALVQRACSRAADLVSSFKQVAVDQTSEKQRPFDLLEIVEDNVTSLRPTIKKATWTIETAVPKGIRCDSFPGPLGQILVNLIQNAGYHAFDEGKTGSVTISASVTNEVVELLVTDNGKGMPPDVLTHIFDPFFTTTLGKGGSGLGLSICRNIATGILGGSLHATSQPGVGTTFHLRFPAVAPANLKARKSTPESHL
jgi:C4-dicarboxylate-specific signal transduction histidine kinase